MKNVCCNQKEQVKKIYLGILLEKPREGESIAVVLTKEKRTIHTSVVEKFIKYKNNVWVVETQNSIYVLQQKVEE